MSGYYASYRLPGDVKISADLQSSAPDGELLVSVTADDGHGGCFSFFTVDPSVLRRIAAACAEVADKADAARSRQATVTG